MESKEWIAGIFQDGELAEKYLLAKEKDSALDKNLSEIRRNYATNKTDYSSKCEATAQNLLMKVLSDEKLRDIHSARYRVKTVESLAVKYVKKKAALPKRGGTDYDIEKYRPMDGKNYTKIITDLIGIRILVRYQPQWRLVHEWIWDTFHKDDREYIKNWLEDYPGGETEDFIVEKPKLYLRDSRESFMYYPESEKIFDVNISDAGYNSIHYLLWFDGKYVELQVRTVYDEAWGECTHDLIYKCKDPSKRAELDELSRCLAKQTQAAGMTADIIYEKANNLPPKRFDKVAKAAANQELQKQTFEKLEKRMQLIKAPARREDEFDGSIDNLI